MWTWLPAVELPYGLKWSRSRERSNPVQAGQGEVVRALRDLTGLLCPRPGPSASIL